VLASAARQSNTPRTPVSNANPLTRQYRVLYIHTIWLEGLLVPKQTFIVNLDSEIARQAREILARPDRDYASMDELITVALMNQISAEASSVQPSDPQMLRALEISGGSAAGALLRHPGDSETATLVEPPPPSTDTLFVLTNRLNPLKVATRVLANLAGEHGWPPVAVFQDRAARAARDFGLNLREHDQAKGLTGSKKRWVAYPVGEDAKSARDRFVVSFTLAVNGERASGPLVLLGLANVVNGDHVALTESGWRLAVARSPLLDGVEGATLSPPEASILREQVRRAPGELAAATEFLELVVRSAGSQRRLDELLAVRHADWSANLMVAHRAAQAGRLGELELLETAGRGREARIRLLPEGERLLGESTRG
jgi:hypothetical protein